MKTNLFFITLLVALLNSATSFAQTTDKPVDSIAIKRYYTNINAEISKLELQKKTYEQKQKEDLVVWVEAINKRVADGKLTASKGEDLKEERAIIVADKIQKFNESIDAQIAFVNVREHTSGEGTTISFGTKNLLQIKLPESNYDLKKEIITESTYAISFGYNFIDGDNLGIDDFSYSNNNFFSLAKIYKTQLNKSHTVRLSYGLAFQNHKTELNANRVFSVGSADTQIVGLGRDVDKAIFRQSQLIVPVHFEFGGAKRTDCEDGRVRFSEEGKFKIGIGGFAGLNLSSRVKIKEDIEGRTIKNTATNAFDNNVFVYGLDAYVGVGGAALFARMNMNDIFKTGSVDGQYVAFGIRLQ